jgi:predicted ribosomally synthesized peptide with nif11-like leader
MSLESAKEFIEKIMDNPILHMQINLVTNEEEAMGLANNYGFTFTEEEMHAAIQEYFGTPQIGNVTTEKRESIKLIDDIDYILQNHEKQYQEISDNWFKNVHDKPDYQYNDTEVAYYGQLNSPLSMTVRNILYHLLEPENGTCCKAEDIFDPLYIKEPGTLWPKINYIPTKLTWPCYPELLVWCFDKDNLDKRFWEMADHLEKCHKQCKIVFFLTSKWYPEVYQIYSDKIEILKNSGVHFTFIFFTMLGATEISTSAATFIKETLS